MHEALIVGLILIMSLTLCSWLLDQSLLTQTDQEKAEDENLRKFHGNMSELKIQQRIGRLFAYSNLAKNLPEEVRKLLNDYKTDIDSTARSITDRDDAIAATYKLWGLITSLVDKIEWLTNSAGQNSPRIKVSDGEKRQLDKTVCRLNSLKEDIEHTLGLNGNPQPKHKYSHLTEKPNLIRKAAIYAKSLILIGMLLVIGALAFAIKIPDKEAQQQPELGQLSGKIAALESEIASLKANRESPPAGESVARAALSYNFWLNVTSIVFLGLFTALLIWSYNHWKSKGAKPSAIGHVASWIAVSTLNITLFSIKEFNLFGNTQLDSILKFVEAQAPSGILQTFSIALPLSGEPIVEKKTIEVRFECKIDKDKSIQVAPFELAKWNELQGEKPIGTAVSEIVDRLAKHGDQARLAGIVLIGSADHLLPRSPDSIPITFNNNLANERAATVERLLKEEFESKGFAQKLWYWKVNASMPEIRILGSNASDDLQTIRAVNICAAFQKSD